MPYEELNIWNIELKGMCRDKDLKIYSELLLKFAKKFQGIGLHLMPADVKTIYQAKNIESEEHKTKNTELEEYNKMAANWKWQNNQ